MATASKPSALGAVPFDRPGEAPGGSVGGHGTGEAGAGRAGRRARLRAALVQDPLLTDADLARRLDVSVPTIRLDRLALGIPEVRDRARAMAERQLRPAAHAFAGEMVDLAPGVSAVALLTAEAGSGGADRPRDPALFADAEALALICSGVAPAGVDVVNVKFTRAEATGGRLVAKAEVLSGRRLPGGRERRVVLVQIRSGSTALLRAKFVVTAGAQGQPDRTPGQDGARAVRGAGMDADAGA